MIPLSDPSVMSYWLPFLPRSSSSVPSLTSVSSDETERVMEDAAPLLAALLVPLKKKYDQISVIVSLCKCYKFWSF